MKRSLSICILVILVLAIFIGLGYLKNSYNSNTTNDQSQILVEKESATEELVVETDATKTEYEFYLTNDDGSLCVRDKYGEIFSLTNISFDLMTDSDKELIDNHQFGFINAAEVYDFLESYSS